MRPLKNVRLITAAVLVAAASAPAQAASLTIVEVGFPAVNCVFNPGCTITVNDTVGNIPLPGIDGAFLQSRNFTGAAGTPGAGKQGYMYRVDLRQAAGFAECLIGLVLNFGPVTKLPYQSGSPPADVFVGTSGGLGTIKVKSAEQDGDFITFTFSEYLCVGPAPNNANTTFFFGLAAATPPKAIKAGMFGFGSPAYLEVDARVPQH